jgi:hypothetical protein
VVHGYGLGTATYQLTLTGTYLTGATSVTWGGASALNGTCGTPTVVNDTTATVNCGNTALAAATRTIAITTPGGTTGTQTVSVAATATVATTLSIAHTGATTAVTITAGGGLTGVSAVGLYSTLGTAVTGVTCTLGTVTDTSVTANCSDTTAGTATSRVFRLTLGGNNTGSIQTNATTVTLN